MSAYTCALQIHFTAISFPFLSAGSGTCCTPNQATSRCLHVLVCTMLSVSFWAGYCESCWVGGACPTAACLLPTTFEGARVANLIEGKVLLHGFPMMALLDRGYSVVVAALVPLYPFLPPVAWDRHLCHWILTLELIAVCILVLVRCPCGVDGPGFLHTLGFLSPCEFVPPGSKTYMCTYFASCFLAFALLVFASLASCHCFIGLFWFCFCLSCSFLSCFLSLSLSLVHCFIAFAPLAFASLSSCLFCVCFCCFCLSCFSLSFLFISCACLSCFHLSCFCLSCSLFPCLFSLSLCFLALSSLSFCLCFLCLFCYVVALSVPLFLPLLLPPLFCLLSCFLLPCFFSPLLLPCFCPSGFMPLFLPLLLLPLSLPVPSCCQGFVRIILSFSLVCVNCFVLRLILFFWAVDGLVLMLSLSLWLSPVGPHTCTWWEVVVWLQALARRPIWRSV